MDVRALAIADVRLFVPKVFSDPRGWFAETYSRRTLQAAGLDQDFVQDNQSFSVAAGTVRGLHFQIAPHAQGKLVRVVAGSIFDVAVDIRAGSPSYGKHVSAHLTAAGGEQLWIPVGFAHGYCTLEPDTAVIYKTTAYYAPEADRGLQWDDPALGIAWPVKTGEAHLSEKDHRQTAFRDLAPAFSYA